MGVGVDGVCFCVCICARGRCESEGGWGGCKLIYCQQSQSQHSALTPWYRKHKPAGASMKSMSSPPIPHTFHSSLTLLALTLLAPSHTPVGAVECAHPLLSQHCPEAVTHTLVRGVSHLQPLLDAIYGDHEAIIDEGGGRTCVGVLCWQTKSAGGAVANANHATQLQG